MRKLFAVGAVLCASVALNVWNELPAASPSKPIYVQKVAQLLDAANRGDWKAACAVAPTGTISYGDFESVLALYQAQTRFQVERICESIVKNGSTNAEGKPLGVTYHIDWWEKDDGKAVETSHRTVVATVTFGDRKPETFVMGVELARIPWRPLSAKCGKPKVKCPRLQWFVLSAS